MSCCCSCDNDILIATATTATNTVGSTSVLLITPDTALAPENEGRIKIKITNATPTAGASLPVYITLNGTAVEVFDRFGNAVYGTELYNGIVLKGYYGNNGSGATSHYQLIKLPKRCCCGC